MTYILRYHGLVLKEDIPVLLVEEWRDRIRIVIKERLTTYPEKYGKPLRCSLKGYRKLHIGDYRVIFRIERQNVKIFIVQHRPRVYETAGKRLQ